MASYITKCKIHKDKKVCPCFTRIDPPEECPNCGIPMENHTLTETSPKLPVCPLQFNAGILGDGPEALPGISQSDRR